MGMQYGFTFGHFLQTSISLISLLGPQCNDDATSPQQHRVQVLSQSGQGNFGQSTIAPHPEHDDDDGGNDDYDDDNEYKNHLLFGPKSQSWLFFPYSEDADDNSYGGAC